MSYSDSANDKVLIKVLSLLSNGKTIKEIASELKTTRSSIDHILYRGRKEHNFRTTYQMLSDFIKSKWWPEESVKLGVWLQDKPEQLPKTI